MDFDLDLKERLVTVEVEVKNLHSSITENRSETGKVLFKLDGISQSIQDVREQIIEKFSIQKQQEVRINSLEATVAKLDLLVATSLGKFSGGWKVSAGLISVGGFLVAVAALVLDHFFKQ